MVHKPPMPREFSFQRNRFTLDRILRGLTIGLGLILVAAIVVLASRAPLYTPLGGVKRSRVQSTKALMSNVKQALQTFKTDTSRFPTNAEGLDALLHAPKGIQHWKGPYMEKLPVDDWGNPLGYKSPGIDDPTSYDLYSFGPDGQEGTDDDIKKADL